MQQHINNPQDSESSSQSMAIRLAELNNKTGTGENQQVLPICAHPRQRLTFRSEPVIDMCSLENQLDTFDTMSGAQ